MIGSVWKITDPGDEYILLVVSPAHMVGWWRCLVLVDELRLEEEGSFINYDAASLNDSFERLF